jgi:hypothetical protein
LRPPYAHSADVGGFGMTSALQRRVEALEDASGGGGGCERCRGTLVVVEDAVTGELKRASWNGQDITGGELQERQSARECPKCGRRIDPDAETEIRIGGRRGPA